LQQKCRKDSQETYQPNNELVRLSQKEWNPKVHNGVQSITKNQSNLEQSEYNHLELIVGNTPGSGLNQTVNLKLSDYLRIVDPKKNESIPNSNQNKSSKNKNKANAGEEEGKYGANITFESLTAIAKIFSDDLKDNEDSDLDLDDDKINDTNIEEVTEDDISENIDKRKSHPEFISKL